MMHAMRDGRLREDARRQAAGRAVTAARRWATGFVVAMMAMSGVALGEDAGAIHTVRVKLKTPKKGTDKRVGELLEEVSFSMYVPPGAKVIRGAVLNPFYEPTVKQEHWRAAVGLWDFALIGTNFFGVRNDELGWTLQQGLKQLAAAGGHAEVEHLPLCPVGMSIGAGLTTRIVEAMPRRIIAAGPVCLEVGPRDEPSGAVPTITIFGERDGKQMALLADKLPKARAAGAQWATAVQWTLRHDFARANNLVMVLFDRAIARRYPAGATPLGGPVQLADYRPADGWLGDPNSWAGDLPAIAPAAKAPFAAAKACWLPDGYTAAVWQAFVVRRPKVTLVEPAGLGDGERFTAHRAAEPIAVRVQLAADLKAKAIELYDGDRKIAEMPPGQLALKIERLEAGIHALIAWTTDAEGRRHVSRPNTIVVVGGR